MKLQQSCRSLHVLRLLTFYFAFIFVLLTIFPANAQHALLTRHVRSAVANGEAKLIGPVSGTQLMRLEIMLPLHNQDGLTALLNRLYDPSSPDYRHFLSVAQFTEQFGPTADDYQTVVQWAKDKGFAVGDPPANRLLVPITGTVAQINAAFNITMKTYQHPTEDRTFFAPDREPTVDLNIPIWHIAGLDNFSIPRPMMSKANAEQSPANITGSGPGGTSYLPKDMRAAYYGGSSLTGSGQCVGIAEFDGYNISDVTGTFDGEATSTTNGNNYTLTYNPAGGGGPYTIPVNNVLLNGGTLTPAQNDPNAEGEVVLDVAQAIGMAPGLSQVRVYIVPDAFSTSSPNYFYPSNSDDAAIFNQMVLDGCKQLSISWNWRPESDTANDPIFANMLTDGQTLFAASGDSGSWPNAAYYYPEEDGGVAAVGGTDLTTNGAGGSWASETAWSGSGGGVSPDDLSVPSYQQLSGFSCTGCSTSYRNAPDIAMEANEDNYLCQMGSCSGGVGGTSFAAPRWAGFMALVNQQAVANGITNGVGFVNPAIYPIALGSNYGSDFHDITFGSNGVYAAVTGYDLVTGWGSPSGQNMINALTSTCAALSPGTYSSNEGEIGLTVRARETDPNQSGVAGGNTGNGFACNPVTSATLYVTVSGTINTVNGNSEVELYYTTDGVHFNEYTEWDATFGPTQVAIPLTGPINMANVYVQLQAQANWTSAPFQYPGVTATANNIYAVTQ